MPIFEFAVDESGYIFFWDSLRRKRYLLVDVPNCPNYGKLKIGEPQEDTKKETVD